MVVVEQPHSPNGGSEIKYRARPNRLWGRPKGPLGGPGPHLSSPILPWFRPERRKSLFWPLGAGTPLWAKKKVRKRRLSPTSDGDGRGGCPRGPGDRGGHGPSRVCGGFPCAAPGPPCCAPKRRLPPAAGRAATRRGPGIQPRRVSRIDYTHGPPWGPLGGP